jgi:hypothetical protein
MFDYAIGLRHVNAPIRTYLALMGRLDNLRRAPHRGAAGIANCSLRDEVFAPDLEC